MKRLNLHIVSWGTQKKKKKIEVDEVKHWGKGVVKQYNAVLFFRFSFFLKYES